MEFGQAALSRALCRPLWRPPGHGRHPCQPLPARAAAGLGFHAPLPFRTGRRTPRQLQEQDLHRGHEVDAGLRRAFHRDIGQHPAAAGNPEREARRRAHGIRLGEKPDVPEPGVARPPRSLSIAFGLPPSLLRPRPAGDTFRKQQLDGGPGTFLRRTRRADDRHNQRSTPFPLPARALCFRRNGNRRRDGGKDRRPEPPGPDRPADGARRGADRRRRPLLGPGYRQPGSQGTAPHPVLRRPDVCPGFSLRRRGSGPGPAQRAPGRRVRIESGDRGPLHGQDDRHARFPAPHACRARTARGSPGKEGSPRAAGGAGRGRTEHGRERSGHAFAGNSGTRRSCR